MENRAGLEGSSPAVLSLMLTAVDLVPWGSQNHLNVPGGGGGGGGQGCSLLDLQNVKRCVGDQMSSWAPS